MLKELSSTIKKIQQWIKKNGIIDVVLFGSAIRVKSTPRDIDLCILIKEGDEEKSLDLVDSLGKLVDKFETKFQINIITALSFISGNTLGKTLLNEGYSVKYNKRFSQVFGLESKSLFLYTLKNFSPSKRVQFHYLLNGRYGRKGVLKEVSGKIISHGSLIISTEKEDLLKEILDKWNVKYQIIRILVS